MKVPTIDGRFLDGIRIRQNMTKATLSKVSGISPSTLGGYLNGQKEITSAKFIKICSVLGINVAQYIHSEGFPDKHKSPANRLAKLKNILLSFDFHELNDHHLLRGRCAYDKRKDLAEFANDSLLWESVQPRNFEIAQTTQILPTGSSKYKWAEAINNSRKKQSTRPHAKEGDLKDDISISR